MKTLWLRRYKGRLPVPILLDDKDYKRVEQYAWWKNGLGYIVARINGQDTLLHRFIMGEPEGKVVDHINGDTLDNRRSNLRVCTIKENVRNARRSKNNTSGHTGVSQHRSGSWRAYIMVDRKQINLGYYENIEDAIKAREAGEQKYFGEFAYQGNRA